MTSATNLDEILSLPDLETKNPYLVKRLSGTGGLVFYQERTNLANGGVPPAPGHLTGHHETSSMGWSHRLVGWLSNQPVSALLLSTLVGLLIILLCSTLYLMLRLDNIQQKKV